MTVTETELPHGRLLPDLEPASWSRRVVAALLDSAVLGAVAWIVAGDGITAPSLQPTFDSGPADDAQPWTSSGVLVLAWLLMLVLQGLTGQTPGRRVVGITVVHAPVDGPVGGPPGVLRSLARWVAHLLDAILLIGYLRPLWHPEGRTFADGLLRTVVLRRAPRTDARGRAVTVVAWVVVAAGVLLGLRLGDAGGTTVDATARCPLAAQDPDAGLRVEDVSLMREVEWRQSQRLWPWDDGARRVESERLSLDVVWDGTDVEPQGPLVVRVTTGGVPVDHQAWGSDGFLSVPVEGAGPVDVEVLWRDRTLTSCTATLPAAG
ncbi:RDD domain containing protein [Cellulomonas flavigena DSM 20109]|uniref:RDD domain containing protein n=1 Tax=Cellulomonas flavigena (strain ATCC 482 / DSM 20109 / BCRC 11376 / JCM 18109 / NBRC 3775 / NCIMB 8073 / NRS 134) TaxID=446466 RepID=D5UK79_CELFN|nr:RDD family protein [Cellulomonas flavigena]ADG75740.1 RDD domain containing protein [Cellulomonas flavigena DSM 20109]